MGFIIKNRLNEDINLSIIKKYKNIVSEDNKNEIYKWKLLKLFNDRPDTSAANFASEITSINFGNLIYHNGIAVRNHMAKEFPEEYRNVFHNLFDEKLLLEERIVEFQNRVSEIYKKMGMKLNHHHDERTISTFLTFKYPEKYTLYKNSFYKSYCDLLGIKPESKNKKYLHYLDLVNNLIVNYIIKDQELIDIKSKFITDDCYPDTNHLIFAQDILYQVLNTTEEISESSTSAHIMKKNNQPLNQILFGPPGTGKTYNTINKAIQIANPEFNLQQDRDIVKNEYDRLLKNGQIVFSTFHQSMSYEDFIEGIKPQIEEDSDGNKTIIYEIKNGVFKLISEKAQEKRIKEETINHQFDFDDAWDAIINDANTGLENNNPVKLTIQTPNLGLKIVDVTEKGNLKLKPIYSEEAKEYIVSYSRTKILQNAFPDLSVIKNIDKEFRAIIGGSNSTAYWSVINYINNKIISEKKSTTQEIVLPALPHVLIIDEINRGNVSQIFGELITLIEENKRLRKQEELKVTLPYSKKEFGVPSNLYIIGTMNTADRSVEALDTALRRRFSFVEMLPDFEVVEKQEFQDGYKRADIMQKINERVELLLDKNYTLGHSYFMKDNFQASFKNEIIPLLQEYFYNDCGKIGLILGKGFVREKEISKTNHQNVFADFDIRNEIEIVKSYELIPFEEVDFDLAVELLLS
ncbi:AAA family ATPase [Chryseobacterium formosus]|uniref:AAA family ATPase n=1 Tax=Chryseobacterium formosus TaxID=1537363 RepID=A0ABT3XLX5_9FLAO|nr:AAA family ATPase [Chryseobacterium formosus]MCX8523124.1 AAA family ATPase [Chryseobacterium formosus]